MATDVGAAAVQRRRVSTIARRHGLIQDADQILSRGPHDSSGSIGKRVPEVCRRVWPDPRLQSALREQKLRRSAVDPDPNGVASRTRCDCPLFNHHLYGSARQYRLFVHRLYPLPRPHPANHHRIRGQLGAVERHPRQKLYPQ